MLTMRVRRRRERERLLERASEVAFAAATNIRKGREEKGGWKREATDRPTDERTNERAQNTAEALPPLFSLSPLSLTFFSVSLARSFALSLFLGPFEAAAAAAASFSAHSGRRRHAADTALPLVPVRLSVPPLSFPFFFLLFCGFPPFLFSFDSLSSLSLVRLLTDGRMEGRRTDCLNPLSAAALSLSLSRSYSILYCAFRSGTTSVRRQRAAAA